MQCVSETCLCLLGRECKIRHCFLNYRTTYEANLSTPYYEKYLQMCNDCDVMYIYFCNTVFYFYWIEFKFRYFACTLFAESIKNVETSPDLSKNNIQDVEMSFWVHQNECHPTNCPLATAMYCFLLQTHAINLSESECCRIRLH